MSYSITVTAKDGRLEVTGSGDVPDGKHVISGHSDADHRQLSVSRHTPDDRQVHYTAAHHSREH